MSARRMDGLSGAPNVSELACPMCDLQRREQRYRVTGQCPARGVRGCRRAHSRRPGSRVGLARLASSNWRRPGTPSGPRRRKRRSRSRQSHRAPFRRPTSDPAHVCRLACVACRRDCGASSARSRPWTLRFVCPVPWSKLPCPHASVDGRDPHTIRGISLLRKAPIQRTVRPRWFG